MENFLSPLDQAKKYREDLAKKINKQRLLTSNKVTKLFIKKSPEEIIDTEKDKSEYIESMTSVREDQKNHREAKKEQVKIATIINQIIKSKRKDLWKLSLEDNQKIKEYLNKPNNKSVFIDKYIDFNLRKKEREEEERVKDLRRYNSGHDFHEHTDPTAISSTLHWLSTCWYIVFNVDTTKLLLNKWYNKQLINHFDLFDKEWQEYLIWYYLKNRNEYAKYDEHFAHTNTVKLQVLDIIYQRNAEYGYDSNYKSILKDLLSDATSHVIADVIADMVDRWISDSQHRDSIRPDIRNLGYKIHNENYKWIWHLKIWHLIFWEKVTEYLTKKWVFDKITTVRTGELEETKKRIEYSFN